MMLMTLDADSPDIAKLNRLIELGWGDFPQGEIPQEVLSGETDAAPAKHYRVTGRGPALMSSEQLEAHVAEMLDRRVSQSTRRRSEAARRAWDRRKGKVAA
jgi:hypothetical protein